MKKIILFFFLVFLQNVNAQKKYHFDYTLEYEVKDSIDSTIATKLFYLANSKDNSFKVEARDKYKEDLSFVFIDYAGNFSKSVFKINDFLKAETYKLDCNFVNNYSNPYKYQVENYFFENLNDTIIDGEECHHYVIKSNRSFKYQKRKSIHKYHYFVKKNDKLFLPMLFSVTPYEEWKEERNIPNGMLLYFYMESIEGKKIHLMKLKKFIKENRYLTIPEECDKTKKI